MFDVFVFLFLTAMLGLVMGLITPRMVWLRSRSSVIKVFGVFSAVFLLLAFAAIPLAPLVEEDVEKESRVNSSPPVAPQQEKVSNTVQNTYTYPVVRVVDGDTVVLEINEEDKKIRLIGIDTPEVVHPNKPVECFGKEASRYAKAILSGKQVQLETDSSQGKQDKYGRLLGYIILPGGENFNKLMIEDGYAYEYTYDEPYKYQVGFKNAQKKAEMNGRGLWSPETCGGER